MPRSRVFILTLLVLLAFAGNSLLCRLALRHTALDAASFTAVRLASGALALWLIVRLRDGRSGRAGNWPSGLALFAYAAAFSFAYVSLPTASGALLLFGSVQTSLMGYGLWRGERLGARQWLGFLLTVGGLVGLLLPGLSAPPLVGALLMIVAGAAWGVYTVRATGSGDPLRATAGNFARATVPALLMGAAMLPWAGVDAAGLSCAVASGVVASGMGYALWYSVLPHLKVTTAAAVQPSVPVIAAFGGVMLLDEHITLRLVVASVIILGGVALVVVDQRTP